jgi:hypothetical protein
MVTVLTATGLDYMPEDEYRSRTPGSMAHLLADERRGGTRTTPSSATTRWTCKP